MNQTFGSTLRAVIVDLHDVWSSTNRGDCQKN